MTDDNTIRSWLRPWCLSRAASAGLLRISYSKPATPFWDQGAHDWGQVSTRVELVLGDAQQGARRLDDVEIAALFDGIETDPVVLAKFLVGVYRTCSAAEGLLGIGESGSVADRRGGSADRRAIEASGWNPGDFGPRLHAFYGQCRELGVSGAVREPCAVFMTSVLPSAGAESDRRLREGVLDGFLGVDRA